MAICGIALPLPLPLPTDFSHGRGGGGPWGGDPKRFTHEFALAGVYAASFDARASDINAKQCCGQGQFPSLEGGYRWAGQWGSIGLTFNESDWSVSLIVGSTDTSSAP